MTLGDSLLNVALQTQNAGGGSGLEDGTEGQTGQAREPPALASPRWLPSCPLGRQQCRAEPVPGKQEGGGQDHGGEQSRGHVL